MAMEGGVESTDGARNRLAALSAGALKAATAAAKLKLFNSQEPAMNIGTILLVVLVLMLIGVFPAWPHSQSWGYGPSGALGFIVIILLVLVITGRL
jgi:hypothetical protein